MKHILISLCVLCFALTVEGPTKPLGTKDRHNRFLQWQCEYYELDFVIMRAMRKSEIHDNPLQKEHKNGTVISRGYFQLSLATVQDFYWQNDIDPPASFIDISYDPYVNQEIACWVMRKYLDMYKGDYKAALSAHNMGPKGYAEYRIRTGHKYRWEYINLIRRNGGKGL
jgi:hypothetical protein